MGDTITGTAINTAKRFVDGLNKTLHSKSSKAPSRSNAPKDVYTPSSGQFAGPMLNSKQAAALKVTWKQPASAAKDPYFSYTGRKYRDLRGATMYWESKPGDVQSPTAANRQINKDYDCINRDMQRYLAGNPKSAHRLPRTADWTTYGKYASREAGEFIRTTENVLSSSKNYDKAGLRTAEGLVRHDLNLDSVSKALGGAKNGLLHPITAAQAAWDLPRDLTTLNKALVTGNTGIHQNIAPAYDAFLRGEAAGGKGLESLEKAGYRKGSKKDRQGFVTQAFTNYQKARKLGLKAQKSSDPVQQARLEAERQKLMDRGNLLLGYQEQMEILQKPDVFEQPSIQRLLGLFSGTMNVTDPNGKYDFLPNGGNWTDFATRMGLEKVPAGTPGADAIKGTDGKTTCYLPDPSQKGTIIDYFNTRAKGLPAWKLNAGHPRELEPLNFMGIMLGDR